MKPRVGDYLLHGVSLAVARGMDGAGAADDFSRGIGRSGPRARVRWHLSGAGRRGNNLGPAAARHFPEIKDLKQWVRDRIAPGRTWGTRM